VYTQKNGTESFFVPSFISFSYVKSHGSKARVALILLSFQDEERAVIPPNEWPATIILDSSISPLNSKPNFFLKKSGYIISSIKAETSCSLIFICFLLSS
jgi:hypothetical protein